MNERTESPSWRALRGLGAGAALLAAWISIGAVGPYGSELRRLLVASFLAVAAVGMWAEGGRARVVPSLVALALGAVAWFGDGSSSLLCLAAGALVLFGLGGFAPVFAALVVLRASASNLPVTAQIADGAAALLSRIVPVPEVDAGPTVLALVPWISASAVCAWIAWSRGRWLYGAIALLLLAAIELWHLRTFHVAKAASSESALQCFEALPRTTASFALVAALLAALCAQREEARARWNVRALSAAAAFGLLCALAARWPLGCGAARGTRVLFLNQGGLDWERPHSGEYSAFGGGMFGLLPVYLRAEGFEPDVLEAETVDDAGLARADVLVLINCQRIWTSEERAAIDRFLRSGHSVLVLGDHTDVFGLKRGFDSLLEPYGIAFRFDSAYHARTSWHGSIEVGSAPCVAWTGLDFQPMHAVGASLDTRAPALLASPFSFSDHGLRGNVMGSYLGDYCYAPGERLGDLVLAAWKDVGRGKLAVYGDTSAFQNGSLSYSWDSHLLALFHWLAVPVSPPESSSGRVVAALIALAFAAACALRPTRTLATAALLGACAGSQAGLVVAHARGARATIDSDTVAIDYAFVPWQGHFEAHMNYLGPIDSNVQRMGLRSLITADARPWREAQPRAIVLVAPLRALEPSDVRELLDYERRGGEVLVAAGGEHAAAVAPLLAAHGLSIEPRPLGSVPVTEFARADDSVPRFVDAWPIAFARSDKQIEVLASWGADTLAVHASHGSGGLVCIADSRFFSDRNVEGMWGHWPGNVRFLQHLFVRFLGAEPDCVRALFRSPEKPE